MASISKKSLYQDFLKPKNESPFKGKSIDEMLSTIGLSPGKEKSPNSKTPTKTPQKELKRKDSHPSMLTPVEE